MTVDLNLYDSYLMKFPNPETGEEAKFSYPHILGTALLKGKVWIDSFTDESVMDREYQEVRKKIEVVVHPEWPAGRVDARTPVTIRLKDGRIFSKEIHTPREPTLDELVDRYREAADRDIEAGSNGEVHRQDITYGESKRCFRSYESPNQNIGT